MKTKGKIDLKFFFIILLVMEILSLKAADSLRVRRPSFIGFPVVFYQPETHWGAGMVGLVRFKKRTEHDSIRYSNITMAFSDTQLNQIVFSAPYYLWFAREKYNVYGELGYQRENYLFFGVGNRNPHEFHERYNLHVARMKLNILRRLHSHLYAGINYSFDRTALFNFEDGGQLISGDIPGSGGGTISGAGITVKFDNRDNQFYATKGYYAEVFATCNSRYVGSDYEFGRYSLNLATYVALPRKQVLAFNAYAFANKGRVPFYQMATLGGDIRLRGLYNGRYRDNNCWILQAEYRASLFWRLGAVAFAGIGDVASDLSRFNLMNTRLAYGGGMRLLIDKKQHLNLRFDVGLSQRNPNYYFTVAEAF